MTSLCSSAVVFLAAFLTFRGSKFFRLLHFFMRSFPCCLLDTNLSDLSSAVSPADTLLFYRPYITKVPCLHNGKTWYEGGRWKGQMRLKTQASHLENVRELRLATSECRMDET